MIKILQVRQCSQQYTEFLVTLSQFYILDWNSSDVMSFLQGKMSMPKKLGVSRRLCTPNYVQIGIRCAAICPGLNVTSIFFFGWGGGGEKCITQLSENKQECMKMYEIIQERFCSCTQQTLQQQIFNQQQCKTETRCRNGKQYLSKLNYPYSHLRITLRIETNFFQVTGFGSEFTTC